MSRLVASSAHRTFPKTKTAASSPVTVTVTVKSLRATQEKSIKTTTINAAAARAVKTLTDLQEAVYEEIQRNYQVLAEARAEERILRRLLQGPLYYACNGHVHSHTDPSDPSPWLQAPRKPSASLPLTSTPTPRTTAISRTFVNVSIPKS
jgi:hypothetical protein